jgi:molybdate transport system ATP-binding protein
VAAGLLVTIDADVDVLRGTFRVRASLHVGDGQVTFVLGPNGSGKTTLLRTIAGLQPLQGGEIKIGGSVVDNPAAGVFVPPERRECVMVFDDSLLFRRLSVRSNVAFGLACRGVGREAARRLADQWLDRMEILPLATQRPDQLSAGQSQRVALARAMITKPRALLLDEPLAALDVSARRSTREWLREQLAEFGGSVVMTTHDPLDAEAGDTALVIEAGERVQLGVLSDVLSNPTTPYVAELARVAAGRARDGG